MKHRVSELEGALLDAAVALIEGLTVDGIRINECIVGVTPDRYVYAPSRKWEQAGPIIERERIMLTSYANGEWEAFAIGPDSVVERMATGKMRGPTTLIAAMRAYVVAKLGHEVELP